MNVQRRETRPRAGWSHEEMEEVEEEEEAALEVVGSDVVPGKQRTVGVLYSVYGWSTRCKKDLPTLTSCSLKITIICDFFKLG